MLTVGKGVSTLISLVRIPRGFFLHATNPVHYFVHVIIKSPYIIFRKF